MNLRIGQLAGVLAWTMIVARPLPLAAQTASSSASAPATATAPSEPADPAPEVQAPPTDNPVEPGKSGATKSSKPRRGNRYNVMGQAAGAAPAPQFNFEPRKAAPKTDFDVKLMDDVKARQAEIQKIQTADAMRSWATMGTSRRTMVLPLSATEPANLRHAHEDLRIMHRLLTKSLSTNPRNIEKFSIRLGAEDRQFDAMYLEGFGALFMLSVDYPLVEPAKPETKPAEAESRDADWESEKQNKEGDSDEALLLPQLQTDPAAAPKEFNPERVNRLRNRMIEAIKHGSNIRTLKPNEEIVIVIAGRTQPKNFVFAPAAADPNVKLATATLAAAGVEPVARTLREPVIASDKTLQSAMVLRVKKSEVDALAANKTSPEDFRSKVDVTTY